MSKQARVMKHAHLLWADYKAGKVQASNSRFGFFLKCAWCYERMKP